MIEGSGPGPPVSSPVSSSAPLTGLALGLALGLAVSALVVTQFDTGREPIRGPEAIDAFLDVWERSRTSTYRAVGDRTRVMDDGTEVEWPVEVIVAPPNEVRYDAGGISGRVEGRDLQCVGDATASDCSVADGVEFDFDAEVADELSSIERMLTATPAPFYVVEIAEDGCFHLDMPIRRYPNPWGTSAEFCFDDETGAMIRAVNVRENAVDTMEISSVSPAVSPSDLEIGT